ncbi:MAG: DNA helicase UvrD [Candidatus Aminicenantes bacterium]|nr:DNA helicase UvrD [Candidatus Aminicenantes bacterium]
MAFFADFHIHSRYSRGTSSALELPDLARWAEIKGVRVVGTGDFTHPSWFRNLKASLRESASGLFELKKERSPTLFILSAELSLIFKQNGKVRKVHLLLLAPSLDAVNKINTSLGRRFNLGSDGRPILGASARDICAEILGMDDRVLVIPAHIWTPWFSLLGSRSGFDSMEECFEDCTPFIHAVETGLSADPPMLARVSFLNRYTVLSNSDAHSAQNIGREANELNCPLTYGGIARAIRRGEILRTIEFFPEEGKYHHDGHRACGVSLPPAETRRLGGKCPVCGKPLTLGVLYRVEELADGVGEFRTPFSYQVPLRQILAQVLRCGEGAKKVERSYFTLIERLGPEFAILQSIPIGSLAAADEPLAKAVQAMRQNHVRRQAGYDGVYGRIVLEMERT